MSKMQNKAVRVLMGLIIIFLFTCMNGCSRTVQSAYYYNPSWLPNGKIICTKYLDIEELNDIWGGRKDVSQSYYIVTMDEDGSNEEDVRQIDAATNGGEIAASPDGRYIAITSGPSIKVYNSEFSDYSTITPTDGKQIKHLDFSPTSEGYKVVYTNEDKELRITDIDSSFNDLLATSAEVVAWRVGDKIVFEDSYYNRIYVSEIDGSGKETISTLCKRPQITNYNRIVYSGLGDKVESMRIDGTDKKLLIVEYSLSTLKLSFDNMKIIGGDWDGGEIMNIYITDIHTGNIKRIR